MSLRTTALSAKPINQPHGVLKVGKTKSKQVYFCRQLCEPEHEIYCVSITVLMSGSWCMSSLIKSVSRTLNFGCVFIRDLIICCQLNIYSYFLPRTMLLSNTYTTESLYCRILFFLELKFIRRARETSSGERPYLSNLDFGKLEQ